MLDAASGRGFYDGRESRRCTRGAAEGGAGRRLWAGDAAHGDISEDGFSRQFRPRDVRAQVGPQGPRPRHRSRARTQRPDAVGESRRAGFSCGACARAWRKGLHHRSDHPGRPGRREDSRGWRMRQSDTNHSLPSNSLITRDYTGNFTVFEVIWAVSSSKTTATTQGFSHNSLGIGAGNLKTPNTEPIFRIRE